MSNTDLLTRRKVASLPSQYIRSNKIYQNRKQKGEGPQNPSPFFVMPYITLPHLEVHGVVRAWIVGWRRDDPARN